MREEPSFLVRLTLRLAERLARLDPERAARHRSALLAFQDSSGGFRGREGEADLYYTSFAVRALALLGGLDEDRARSIARYLETSAAAGRYTLVDLVSWLFSAATLELAGALPDIGGNREAVAAQAAAELESFRRPDGGYARTREGGSGSTYHTFLAVLCYELLGLEVPLGDAIVRFVLGRRRGDGGFVEIGPMRRSGTNPTAAAAVLLDTYGALTPEVRGGIGEFLAEVRGDEGGLRANTRVPFCDALSTFTGLLVALDLGIADRIDVDGCARFVRGLEMEAGGFHGAAWDEATDPEYTFYGLGTLALASP